MLTLRDPADETNDLGRKTVAWKHVRATWKLLLDQLRVDTQANTRASLLARLVGPAYTLQRARRKRLAEYGQSLTTQHAAVAQTMRNGEPVASESEPTVGTNEEHEGWQLWLTHVGNKSDHKDTGDAFSGLLGLDKSITTKGQEE